MDLGLQGKVALVAAATSGLGLAIAEEMMGEGAHVAICGRDPERLRAAETRLRAAGEGEVLASRVDVTDADAVRAWVDAAAERFGRLDVVVANNGGVPVGQASDYPAGDYHQAVATCMLPAINIVQRALPHLKAAPAGRVLIVTSEAVRHPPRHFALSSTARAGLIPFAKVLTQELRGTGVTVNVIAPGCHRTRIHEANRNGPWADQVREVESRIPLQRLGEPEEFAAVATFLASARASFITGTVVTVDGGLSAAV